ncbi:MAG: helix-turn-helix transcriptional regulator [Candidatus Atribacteria bacterium]|nr:helix-turn-helix transcriptional regulator [Candidatus Atribacteria bacterium]
MKIDDQKLLSKRDDKEGFAQWLRDKIAEKHLTPGKFARLSGVSKTQVYRYVNAEQMPHFELHIKHMAQVLEVDIDDFYFRIGLKRHTVEEFVEHIRNDTKMHESICPAQIDWWDRGVFSSYYLVKDSNDPNLIIDPALINEIKQSENGNRCFEYKGEQWIDTGIRVHWSQGQMANQQITEIFEWDHWHSTFVINSLIIHIDFISFFRGSPQTAYREYRVFANDVPIGRGGGFEGFLGGNFLRKRNWPMVIEIGDYLLYIAKTLQRWSGGQTKGTIDDLNACLVLKKVSLFPGNID